MALTWFVGVQGVADGYTAITNLREGNVPDVASIRRQVGDDPMNLIQPIPAAAKQQAASDSKDVTFPLGVAKLLLSGLLVLASGLAMTGRPGARALALQALAANVAFAGLDYTLTRQVRAAWIESVARVFESLPHLLPEYAVLKDRAAWWWFERSRFALFDIGVLGVASLALLRERTKLYFRAVADAAETSEEP
jgi:hypothetical protein